MADFSYLSDTDDSAVEDLISQTKDLCALEQISAINCSSITDSDLPADLDSRFRKLKSFPLDQPKSSLVSSNKQSSASKSDLRDGFDNVSSECKGVSVKAKEDEQRGKNPDGKAGFEANSSSGSGCGFDSSNKGSGLDEEDFNDGSWNDMVEGFDEESEGFEEKLDGKRSLKEKKKGGFYFSPSSSVNSSSDDSIFSTTKRIPNRKIQGKSTAKSRSFPYGCFLCSPKKKKKKKNESKRNRVKEMGLSYDWNMNMNDDDGFLSDLRVFSKKERDKILKKAVKEEEKISREAEKIVHMAKQASARMDVSYGIKDELGDDGDD